ncbi:MAG: 6-bladed beta-propeller [Bacteroidales bacterium]
MIVILITTACNSSKNKESIPVINLNSMSVISDKSELDSKSLNMTQTLIPLETTDSCLLSKISSVEESKEAYWIISDGLVFKFSKQGKFIQTIGGIGQGPEEYLNAYCLQIDEPGNIIYVMDYFGRKMVTYTLTGDFIKSFELPHYSYNSFILNGSNIYFYGFENSVTPALLKLNTKTMITDTISRPERTMEIGESFMGKTFINKVADQLYMYHYFNDSIFQIEPDNKLKTVGFLDMQNMYFDYDELIAVGDYQMKKKITDPRAVVSNFIDTEKYYMVFYEISKNAVSENRRKHLAVYDKLDNKQYPNTIIINKQDTILNIKATTKIFYSNENVIISIIDADQALASKLLPDINEDDNPVLVIHEL